MEKSFPLNNMKLGGVPGYAWLKVAGDGLFERKVGLSDAVLSGLWL